MERNNIKRFVFPIVYVIVVTVSLFLLFSGWAYDDPFITYRYAANLAQGVGFVYNLGERVLSTTTPLFTLGLAPFAFLGERLPRIAVLFGTISLALGGLLIWSLGQAWKTPLVGWVGLILYPTFPLMVMTLGSETPLYLALSLGTFSAYVYKRYTLAGILAALTILTRPDGAILAVILAADFLIYHREPFPWKAIIIFAGLLIAWVGFTWVYFGSPVPATLATKQHQGSMAISQRFAAGFLTVAEGYASWPYILEMIVAIGGIVFAIWKKRRWLLFLSWPVTYFAAYAILGVSRYFWYYAPLVPGFIVSIGLGVASITFLLEMGITRSSVSQSRVIPITVAVVLGVFVFGQAKSLLAVYQNRDQRLAIYRAVGEWLEANTESTNKIGALEVGIIGFYAQRPMVDFAGLIQPQVAEQLNLQTTYEDAALYAVGRFHPEYLVLQEGVFPQLEVSYVAQSCELMKNFQGEEYGYPQDINVFACSR